MRTWGVASLTCSRASCVLATLLVEDTASLSKWTSIVGQGESGAGWVGITCPIAGLCCEDLSFIVSIRLCDKGTELQTVVVGSTVAVRLLRILDVCWSPSIVYAVGASGITLSLIVPVGSAGVSLVFVGIVLRQMSAF